MESTKLQGKRFSHLSLSSTAQDRQGLRTADRKGVVLGVCLEKRTKPLLQRRKEN